jgi:hypothetical protein
MDGLLHHRQEVEMFHLPSWKWQGHLQVVLVVLSVSSTEDDKIRSPSLSFRNVYRCHELQSELAILAQEALLGSV